MDTSKCPVCGKPFKHGELTGLPLQDCRCPGVSISQDLMGKIIVRVFATCKFCRGIVPKEGFVHSRCRKKSLQR
jgi:hypothetical protein